MPSIEHYQYIRIYNSGRTANPSDEKCSVSSDAHDDSSFKHDAVSGVKVSIDAIVDEHSSGIEASDNSHATGLKCMSAR